VFDSLTYSDAFSWHKKPTIRLSNKITKINNKEEMKTNLNSRESLAPVAYIAKGRQRIKQYGDTVYLKNGDEFQIEIFNPTDTKVSARIELNGKSIGSGIILRPGERIFLDRHVQEAKKFLFETYKVNGDSKQVQQAIESNGDLVVKFHKEKAYVAPYYYGDTIFLSPNSSGGTYRSNGMGVLNNVSSSYSTGLINGQNSTYTSNLANFSNNSDDKASAFVPCNYSSSSKTKEIETGRVDKVSASCNYSSSSKTKEIETGRVEKGSYSDQKFKPDYTSFEYSYSWISKWKILPESRKEVVSEDLVQYCVICGRRKKPKELYCPKDGNKF
jgi:hypothetical protein